MTHKRTELGYFIHLGPGEELTQCLTAFAKRYDVLGGEISVIGLAEKVTLGFYTKAANNYTWQEFTEPLEITTGMGTISTIDGEPVVHLHGTFARSDFSVIGGHVQSLTIGNTGEVVIIPHDVVIERKQDPKTGMCPWFFEDQTEF